MIIGGLIRASCKIFPKETNANMKSLGLYKTVSGLVHGEIWGIMADAGTRDRFTFL